ncbi:MULTISPECIES: sensor domain-containing diguanylate cyclase [unclassified Marinimicrobium]|jgi:diguanylate cyclase (GGDEF)-like protein/PAS domain S-box-containing protein|uniref:sensor domain-containing diguanylate cyclase n=1 Tax=Marinimicrobium TaxID=359337 RepID=UPI0004661E01|nr:MULTISPECIES: sensor domain-containing diguanylate cyclase [unclassified Marinimicrobium]|tara:strand:- start:214 stop:1146 length:933 start_codon:yes stop_codon:yes gene_type:complete
MSSPISDATDSAVYKTLLESTKAIPWKIDWATMKFAYIGPQIEALLGWTPESWVSVEDWATRMHPEDRDWVVNFCVSQSQSGVDHEADYRALTKDGDYVWIRDVVHVARNEQGEVEALIGFMFDISERKKTEQELIKLQKELETLSYQDGLTGVANRRMLDSILDVEWLNARRNCQPLSVLLIDIDYFKQYNDRYGHLQGDDCLRSIAQTLDTVASRPRDFLARFGGEEFMLVLPETDGKAAHAVADRCRQAILKLQIPHAASDASQLVSISVGVASIIPDHECELAEFIESADRKLYQAKLEGRDRVVA